MAKKIILGVTPEFYQREGLSSDVAAWEDGQREDTGPGHFEWWYFDAHFEDGATAVIVFATKSLYHPQDPLTPMILLTVTRPDGTRIPCSAVFPPEQFVASKETCDVHIGPNHVHGDLHTFHIEASVGEVSVALEMTGIVPAWRPGAGKNYYDTELTHYFAWLPSIPYGRVKGTITYDGLSRQVSGSCYHDHNWGNTSLAKVMSHWYWGRAHVGDYTLIFVEMVATREYSHQKMPVFLLAKGDQILTGDGTPLQLTTHQFVLHPAGRKYPEAVDFDWQDGCRNVHLALSQPKMIEATSLLGFLPGRQRFLARLIANPYYFRFKADLDLAINMPGLQDHQTGKAIYEIMLLR